MATCTNDPVNLSEVERKVTLSELLNGIGINNVKLMEFEYTFVELNGIGYFGIGIDFFLELTKMN